MIITITIIIITPRIVVFGKLGLEYFWQKYAWHDLSSTLTLI